MTDQLADKLSFLGSPAAITFVLASLPISELRGALVYALTLTEIPLVKAYCISVAGNMLPIPFILYLLGPISEFISKSPAGARFVQWIFARTRARSETVRKYETLGLILFVAIPLPVTGAWTGSMAAFLFGLRKIPALIAVFCGVLIAGVVVSVVTLGAQEAFAGFLHLFGR
ncbi:MAG: small multi-drug export protein [Candidatus Hydrogenedentes bacterium]|nr:small multi-drug export protein [Candidatus Hydrogenedentota bacterium]